MTDTDPAHHDDIDQGDGPDTFDDRLADLARLVELLPNETDPGRRLRRRLIVVRLLGLLGSDALTRITAVLDRLDELDEDG